MQKREIKEEIDFRDLVKNPKRLFGFSLFYFLIIFITLGILYVRSLNDITRNAVEPVLFRDSTALVLDVPAVRGAVIPPVDINKVRVPTKELVEKGRTLFAANCASCHGDNGQGDGSAGIVMNPKPRNFHSPDGWVNGRKISQMYKTLQEGILKSGMPSFNYFPAEDRFALIHYVRTFADNFPLDGDAEFSGLETTYQLSKGSLTSPQIPIKVAMVKLTQEHGSEISAMQSSMQSLDVPENDRVAGILHEVVRDKNKIIASALHMSGKTADEWMSMISSDPYQMGFKPAVLRLNTEEWNVLYSYLSKLGTGKKTS